MLYIGVRTVSRGSLSDEREGGECCGELHLGVNEDVVKFERSEKSLYPLFLTEEAMLARENNELPPFPTFPACGMSASV